MKATIYHNRACGTSRKTLDILQEEGAEIEIIDYLKAPPTREELQGLYQRAGLTPRQGLRTKEPLAAELGLLADDSSDDTILEAMAEHPRLIERLLVETDKGLVLARPAERVRDIL